MTSAKDIDNACGAVRQAVREARRGIPWAEAKEKIADSVLSLVAVLDTDPLAYAKSLAEEVAISVGFCTEPSDLEVINIERETEAIRNIARRDAA